MKLKQISILSIFLSLNAQESTDPMEKAIIKHDLKAIKLLSNYNALTKDQKQKYLQLAQVAVNKTHAKLNKKHDVNEDSRMVLGALALALGAWSINECYSVWKDTVDDDRKEYIYIGISGLLLSYFGFNEWYKGWTKYDREKAYNNANYIQYYINAIKTN